MRLFHFFTDFIRSSSMVFSILFNRHLFIYYSNVSKLMFIMFKAWKNNSDGQKGHTKVDKPVVIEKIRILFEARMDEIAVATTHEAVDALMEA